MGPYGWVMRIKLSDKRFRVDIKVEEVPRKDRFGRYDKKVKNLDN